MRTLLLKILFVLTCVNLFIIGSGFGFWGITAGLSAVSAPNTLLNLVGVASLLISLFIFSLVMWGLIGATKLYKHIFKNEK